MPWKSKNTQVVGGVDLGSSKVSVVLGEIDNAGKLSVLGIGKSPLEGVEKGEIVSSKSFTSSLKTAIQKAEQKAGIQLKKMICTAPNFQIEFKKNLGVIVSRSDDGKISKEDKSDCIKKARNIVKSSQSKILHVIPLQYRVDGKEVSNPVGMEGTHLEVDAGFVLGNTDMLAQMSTCFESLAIEELGYIYDGLSHSELMLSKEDRQVGTLLLDMGAYFTKASYFINNVMSLSTILPLGGEAITRDIATCLKVTIPEAERLKIIYGTPLIADVDASEVIKITTREGVKTIKKRLLSQIIEARVDEMLKLIKKQLGDIFIEAKSITLTGESTQLYGLGQFIESRFNKKLKTPPVVQGLSEQERISYIGALGAIVYGMKSGVFETKRSGSLLKRTEFKKVKNWIPSWLGGE